MLTHPQPFRLTPVSSHPLATESASIYFYDFWGARPNKYNKYHTPKITPPKGIYLGLNIDKNLTRNDHIKTLTVPGDAGVSFPMV